MLTDDPGKLFDVKYAFFFHGDSIGMTVGDGSYTMSIFWTIDEFRHIVKQLNLFLSTLEAAQ